MGEILAVEEDDGVGGCASGLGGGGDDGGVGTRGVVHVVREAGEHRSVGVAEVLREERDTGEEEGGKRSHDGLSISQGVRC